MNASRWPLLQRLMSSLSISRLSQNYARDLGLMSFFHVLLFLMSFWCGLFEFEVQSPRTQPYPSNNRQCTQMSMKSRGCRTLAEKSRGYRNERLTEGYFRWVILAECLCAEHERQTLNTSRYYTMNGKYWTLIGTTTVPHFPFPHSSTLSLLIFQFDEKNSTKYTQQLFKSRQDWTYDLVAE